MSKESSFANTDGERSFGHASIRFHNVTYFFASLARTTQRDPLAALCGCGTSVRVTLQGTRVATGGQHARTTAPARHHAGAILRG